MLNLERPSRPLSHRELEEAEIISSCSSDRKQLVKNLAVTETGRLMNQSGGVSGFALVRRHKKFKDIKA